MLAIFSLRLALGLLACLLILPGAVVHPRFYRTHFLTAMGLIVVAGLVLADSAGLGLWCALGTAGALCLLGSILFRLEGAPGHRLVAIASVALTALALFLIPASSGDAASYVNDLTAAAVLGASMTAMLMGHSYLIAPAMSLTPLLRLLAVLAGALLLRALLAGVGLWLWTTSDGHARLDMETLLWLGARWVVGFAIPLVLCWMAWETTKIRSTQSATGILYVVVMLCFLGELTSQLLHSKTPLFF